MEEAVTRDNPHWVSRQVTNHNQDRIHPCRVTMTLRAPRIHGKFGNKVPEDTV